eukprot:462730_1
MSTRTLSNCIDFFYEQPLDHFNSKTLSSIETTNNKTTYMQRYFICGDNKENIGSSTLFFYFGNEATVELYIKNTGLMWENYLFFDAVLIFAEHRYFGKSKPFHKNELNNNKYGLYNFLTPNQALEDYKKLIEHLNPNNIEPLIGFGGSYGGMLCSWFSMKYSSYISGCIAASAPILDAAIFHKKYHIQKNYFSRIVTNNLIHLNKKNKMCVHNIRKSYKYLFKFSKTHRGRKYLSEIFNFCDILQNETMANATAYWTYDAIATMSMGSYPYYSSYMTNKNGTLPPFPLNYGCNKYMNNINDENGIKLLFGLSDIINIYYNASKIKMCYNINKELHDEIFGVLDASKPWNYIECAALYSPYSSSDGINDMFWVQPWNKHIFNKQCINSLNVKPNFTYVNDEYSKYINDLNSFYNVIFSYGLGDPWNGGCPRFNNTNNGIYSISYGFAGHHQDLMFSNKNDPNSVINARIFEMKQIEIWINQHYKLQTANDSSWFHNYYYFPLLFVCGIICSVFYKHKSKGNVFMKENWCIIATFIFVITLCLFILFCIIALLFILEVLFVSS